MSAVHAALTSCPEHTIAVLTCQKRAAAPMKPGEFRKSSAMRLCDEFALAGIFSDYERRLGILCAEGLVNQASRRCGMNSARHAVSR